MRLRRRPTPTELVHQTSDDGVRPRQEPEIPLKAQGLLGTRPRQDRVAPRIDTPEPLREVLRSNQKSLATYPEARGSSEDTTPTARHAMPWPGVQRANLSSSDVRTTSNSSGAQHMPQRNGSGQSVRPNQFYTEQKPSLESAARGYYDSTKQPLHVSQQTSASAVRDMALRKGSPTVQDIASSPSQANKPLKSALKQPKAKDTDVKKSKKLDVMSLFPQPKASSGPLLSPAKYTHSPAAATENSEYFPQETIYAQVRRQGPKGRFETYTNATPSPVEPVNARGLPRVKIFERDIYDETKTHKRKPPKGIQNWFDGFYISSDDEDQDRTDRNDLVELPAEPSLSSPKELSAEFGPYNGAKAVRNQQGQAGSSRRESLRPTLHVQPAPNRREHRSHSETSTANGIRPSAAVVDAQFRLGDSRLAHSQLETQSILALSDSEEERSSQRSSIRDGRHINKASATKLQRPIIPPRKVHSKSGLSEEIIRKSTSTAQTSGSIPIRVADSIEIPPVPTPRKVQSPRESNAATSPRLLDSPSLHSKNQPTSRSGRDKDEMQSAAGETTSSVPTDASHLMAVTDEEMMLLELMRQKRAAMQKNSFAEGYRLALKQEEEHLAKKRSSAHSNALKMLKLREEGKLQSTTNSRADSRTESLFSDESREQRKRYSMIRKGSVDKNFRLGRFLGAMESTAEDGREVPRPANLAQLERFLVMKPSLLDAIQGSRPVSGTEIEAETMTEEDDTFDEGYTIDEDDIVDENGVIIQPGAPSPMQRLTEMARGSPPSSVSPLAEEASEVETRDDILSDAETSRMSGLTQMLGAVGFPTPPRNDFADVGYSEGKQAKRRSLLSPAMGEDEPLLPGIPARSPNRTPLQVEGLRTRGPRTPRQSPCEPTTARRTPDSAQFPMPTSKFAQYDQSSLGLDLMTLELPPAIRSGSPSSRASPLTPTFSPVQPVGKPAVATSASDGSSFRDLIDTSSPDRPETASPIVERKPGKKLPPRIQTSSGKSVDRITSMSSITSAGEDVLAAWAELGGGGDALAARRRGL